MLLAIFKKEAVQSHLSLWAIKLWVNKNWAFSTVHESILLNIKERMREDLSGYLTFRPTPVKFNLGLNRDRKEIASGNRHHYRGMAHPTVHSDAFFRSQRDINRHGSWLDFWKIQVNLVNFISGTFGTAWDKYSKNGLTFGCLREKKGWNFDLEIIFFKQKQDFGIFI